MTVIYSYQKHIDQLRTVELKRPVNEKGEFIGEEIATINGVTYVAIPDNATLPEQPTEISATKVKVTTELKEELKAASPRAKFIETLVRAKIAEKYDLEDEIGIIRTAPSAKFDAYNAYVDSCKSYGHSLLAEIGL